MTTTTAFDRLANAAVSARHGADLFRFGLANRIPDSSFAKNADGTVTITGVDQLKVGTFNGLQLVDGDLDAMVDRFRDLRDSGVFLPPFRLDHSWSILSVIGWFEELETYVRTDDTDGLSKLFLRGDVRITGSVDYTPGQIVDAIKRGSLRSRSSELGYYVTNAGVELPLVFYGSAFVDIPAVEGLAPVALSRTALSVPHKITNLSEGSSMEPDATTQGDAVEAVVEETPGTTGETTEETTATTAVDVDPGETDATAEDAGDGTAVEAGPESTAAREDAAADDGETPPEGDPAEEVVEESTNGDTTTPDATAQADDEVERLRREIATLRREATDREIARFRSAGVIVQANEDAATALLSHDDEGVRRAAGTLLSNLPSTVVLDRRRGRTTLSHDSNASGEGGSLIRLGMSKDEVGPLWASLSTEEREKHRDDYSAWRRDRDENGIRD